MDTPLQTHSSIDPAIVHRASQWMARLWSGEASEVDIAACAAWRGEHPDHERAWRRLQGFEDRLFAVPGDPVRRVLLESHPPRFSRRSTLSVIGAAFLFPGTAYTVRRTDAWQLATSDLTTRTGDIRTAVLPDGTKITLDTASAVDVRYTSSERRVVLRTGRIFIATARDPNPSPRPFVVECLQGTVRPLGTRFTVQQYDGYARAAVFEGAIEVRARRDNTSPLRLDAGQQSLFSDEQIQAALPVQETDATWTKGNLVAIRMRVADLVEELNRYRRGILRCDESAANLRVTGVFPLLDTDRALADLMIGVQVDVVYRTPYWVTVRAT